MPTVRTIVCMWLGVSALLCAWIVPAGAQGEFVPRPDSQRTVTLSEDELLLLADAVDAIDERARNAEGRYTRAEAQRLIQRIMAADASDAFDRARREADKVNEHLKPLRDAEQAGWNLFSTASNIFGGTAIGAALGWVGGRRKERGASLFTGRVPLAAPQASSASDNVATGEPVYTGNGSRDSARFHTAAGSA